MESEKVKEIKKVLSNCVIKDSCCDCPNYFKKDCIAILHKETLTLINELESENERLERRNENLINKRYEEFENFGIQWENDENNKKRKTNKYLKNFSMELLLYYQQQYTNNQQLKDRIAELENQMCRNEDLHTATEKLNDMIILKQFTEMLKEKVIRPCDLYDCVTVDDIDETLKEFIEL